MKIFQSYNMLGAKSLAILFGLVLSSIPVFANVGFCPVGGDCFTGTGSDGETISISGTSFQMVAHSGSGSTWDLLLAIPNGDGAAPTLTFAGNPFTLNGGFPVDSGDFTTGNLYAFAGLSNTSPASMSAMNMFGVDEQFAFGGTPSFFEVFDYRYTGAFASKTAYTITVTGSNSPLPPGTFVAANGGDPNSSTPFTTTGLVSGPVPEPSQVYFLLGAVGLIGLMRFRKQRGQA